MNHVFLKSLLIIVLVFIGSCGKKRALEKFPDSDYPKQYPIE